MEIFKNAARQDVPESGLRLRRPIARMLCGLWGSGPQVSPHTSTSYRPWATTYSRVIWEFAVGYQTSRVGLVRESRVRTVKLDRPSAGQSPTDSSNSAASESAGEWSLGCHGLQGCCIDEIAESPTPFGESILILLSQSVRSTVGQFGGSGKNARPPGCA